MRQSLAVVAVIAAMVLVSGCCTGGGGGLPPGPSCNPADCLCGPAPTASAGHNLNISEQKVTLRSNGARPQRF